MRVPGVTVHDVDAGERAGHLEVLKQRRKQLGMAWVLSRQLNGGDDATNVQVPSVFALLAEAQYLYRVSAPVERGQLPGQILDVDAGAAVDVRRILVRENRDVHRGVPARRGACVAADRRYTGGYHNQVALPLSASEPLLNPSASSRLRSITGWSSARDRWQHRLGESRQL